MKRKNKCKRVFIIYDNELLQYEDKVYMSFMPAVRHCTEPYQSIGVFVQYKNYREFVKFIDVCWYNGLPIFRGL